jgi:hypothetical protein
MLYSVLSEFGKLFGSKSGKKYRGGDAKDDANPEGEAGGGEGGEVAGEEGAVSDTSSEQKASVDSTTATLKVVALAFGVLLLLWLIYSIMQWHSTNAAHYPVLLSAPVRGAEYESIGQSRTVYPVVDRTIRQTGIRLPFANNKLAFMPSEDAEPLALPELNHQVQFTLSFWMKAENIGQVYTDSGGAMAYAQLFVQNNGQFAVLYDVQSSILAVKVRLHSETVVYRFVDSVRVQAWQHVAVVLDNRVLDLYVDGGLRHSRTLPNVPELEFNTWRLYPGKTAFAGMVSCARYYDYALNRYEAKRDYVRCKPSDLSKLPRERYWLWWTWYRGSGFTSIFNRAAPVETPVQAAHRQGRTVIPYDLLD